MSTINSSEFVGGETKEQNSPAQGDFGKGDPLEIVSLIISFNRTFGTVHPTSIKIVQRYPETCRRSVPTSTGILMQDAE